MADLTANISRAISFRKTVVASSDDVVLDVFDAGEVGKPVVILIGAYGMPIGFFQPLIEKLVKDWHLIAWEARGILNTDQPFDEQCCDVAAQSRDFGAVLDAWGVARAKVIAWCSGALVTLRFAARFPDRVESAVLLSGAFPLPGLPLSEFSSEATQLFRRCASSRSRARAVWQLLFSGNRSAQPGAGALLSAWGDLPPELLEMANAPYRSPEALYRYSNTVLRARDELIETWISDVRLPVLLVGGARDTIVHPETWPEMCRKIPGSQLVMREDGDHLMFYRDASLPALIAGFFAGNSAPASRCDTPG